VWQHSRDGPRLGRAAANLLTFLQGWAKLSPRASSSVMLVSNPTPCSILSIISVRLSGKRRLSD